MQSPFESTISTSNGPPGSTSTVPSALTSAVPSALTSAALSAVPSTVPSALTSDVPSNVPSALPSALPLTMPSSPASASDADGAVSTSAENVARVPNALWAGFSSQLDPEQLRFQIGPSASPSRVYSTRSLSSVTITAVPSKPSTSTGLFGSEVVSEASRAPGRFKFQTQAQTQAPAAAPSRKLAGQSRDTRASPGRTINNAPQYTSPPGTSGQTQRIPLPNLGPDVVIRPVSSLTANRKPPGGGPKLNPHPGLQDSEIFQLLSGYRYLKDEVASLKVQLANSQALMQEILNNFSTEVAKINIRLTAVEQGRTGNDREQGRIVHEQGRIHDQGRIEHEHGRIVHEQGRMEHGQGRIDHELGRIEHDQGSIDHGQGRITHEQGRIEHEAGRIVEDTCENEKDEQECLSSELGNLTLTK